MAAIKITTDTFEQEVMKSDKPVLVDFWADWCGPCKMLSPLVEEIAEERTDIKVCKVNVDEEPELALKYKVMSIPMLIKFEQGEVTKKSIGAISKSELISLLD